METSKGEIRKIIQEYLKETGLADLPSVLDKEHNLLRKTHRGSLLEETGIPHSYPKFNSEGKAWEYQKKLCCEARDYSSFEAAIKAIGPTKETLVKSTSLAVTSDITVPSTCKLRFERGGELVVATEKTITINGDFEAGPYQVFKCTGTGRVLFGPRAVKEVRPEWWGSGVIEDDAVAINAAIASLPTGVPEAWGGSVFLSPATIYGILTTININISGIHFGSIVGGMYGYGSCSIRAKSGFAGPLLKINISPGDKGAWIEHVRLSGNGEAGVTRGIEYAADTINTADLNDVSIYDIPFGTGLLTGPNCQSLKWKNVVINQVKVGIDIGAKNRHIVCQDSNIRATDVVLYVGADNAVPGDRCASINFINTELYLAQPGSGAPNYAIVVRNAFKVSFDKCWVEMDAVDVITAMILVGTGNSAANYVSFTDCLFEGNLKAYYAIRIFQASYVFLWGANFFTNLLTDRYLISDPNSVGNILSVDGMATWTAPTLLNSWVDYNPAAFNPAGYFKDPFGIVHLRGFIKNGTAATLFVLPVGVRPYKKEIFVAVSNSAIARIGVETDGTVTSVGYSTDWLSLDGMTFRAVV